MKQIEIKDIEFNKYYITTIFKDKKYSIILVHKTIDRNNKIIFKDSNNYIYDIEDLNISKIGIDANGTVYALNHFKDFIDASVHCAFENSLIKDLFI